jgi:hypothetical protein
MEPEVYKPKKKVDKQGYDEQGTQHNDCGTPECCGTCETSDTQEDKENGGI